MKQQQIVTKRFAMLPNLRNFNLWVILAGDFLIVAAAYLASYIIRFDGRIPTTQMDAFQSTIIWIIPLYLFTFNVFNLYKGMWRYTSIIDSLNLFKAVALATVISMITVLLTHGFSGFSRSVFIINGLLIFLLVGGFRILIRFSLAGRAHLNFLPTLKKEPAKKLLIIGAGSAGEKLIRELSENRSLNYQVVGLVDDNPAKQSQMLHGIPVLGPLDRLISLVEKLKADEIAIAIPSASVKQMRSIIDVCKKTKAVYKTLPGIGDIIQGKITFSALREVRYEDLLKRSPIRLDNDSICGYLTNKCVLVTGGAGSIGSELCRQIAGFSPQKLIVLERNESGLYELVLDIKAAFPELTVIPALAAVQNMDRMTHIFSLYRPQVVFHAAAYKHVPMMENHPWEAIFNNVQGSRVLLEQCRRFDVQRCVMVSTDKAVRPTNVMGASKRLVELLTQSYAALNGTRYMAVRFGNVLGSVGSVLPLFKKQIAAGGPVTVTDPEMTRYFMTIPEACSLILQSGAYGRGGEVFVLKMGTAVRIDEMARDLISLSGYRVDEDIEIRYTGLRPGEKLYEELITEGEGIQKTQHEDIMVLAADGSIQKNDLEAHIGQLLEFAGQGDAEKIKAKLHNIIPEYCPWSDADQCPADSLASQKTQKKPQTPRKQPLPLGSGLNQVAVQDRLLLQLLAVEQSSSRALAFEALPIPDWEKIIQSALRHNVASLLYLRLKRTGVYDQVPLKIAERLRKIYLYFIQTSMRQQYWLGKLFELLEQNDLPVMVLNAPHLGENIYGNIAARPILTVNLLLSDDNLQRLAVIQKEVDQIIGLSGLDIHIGSKISYPNFDKWIPTHDIQKRANLVNIANHRVNVPCPEDLLLQLCLEFVYLYRYRFTGIQTLCDICEIMQLYHAGLNWDLVLKESRRLAMTNAVGLTLILAEDLLNAPVLDKTLAMFGSKDQLSFAKRFALKNIFDEDHLHIDLPQKFFELWESKSLFKKTRALLGLILASPHAVPDTSIHIRRTVFNLNARITQLSYSAKRYAKTIAMLLVRDKELLELFRQQQQNTLIWEWIHGKREF